MKVLKLFALAAFAAMAGCSCDCCGKSAKTSSVSPDGRNEIRLSLNPLAYEVLRDGVVVVAKTEIGMKVDDKCLYTSNAVPKVSFRKLSGTETTPVYKKAKIDLAANERFFDFGDWGVRLIARNDGVAYRFETKFPGKVTVNCEKAPLTIPFADAKCWFNQTGHFGCEENVPHTDTAGNLKAGDNNFIYLPFGYTVGGKWVVVTESDVRDYPVWNFTKKDAVNLNAIFARFPKRVRHIAGWGSEKVDKGGRWVRVEEREEYLTKTEGTRTFPWRTFVLADSPAKFCEADIVNALAPAPAKDADFSWVKPGKVTWDWWNCFDNCKIPANGGCNTKTYERFIDFASAAGVEYVIFDEGWSESLNIWKFHRDVDVPHLIKYAEGKGVGIILWMAWAQIYGEEEKVVEHFAKLGAKGFKVDFMDRGDAEIANFLNKLAAVCAKHKMLVDYHGVYRPVGLSRAYPNVVNYEGIHGLEQLKWFRGYDKQMMFNDVAAFYLRLTAGPMDYTPGAMNNHAIGAGYKGDNKNPGSVGTRVRQMAMMALYEAPLQMLCDSPTNYEKNMECFNFMAKVPTVWDAVVGLKGCPDTVAAVARKAKDGSWYAAAVNTAEPLAYTLDTVFLGSGEWKAEIFRDAPECDKQAEKYIHETIAVEAGKVMELKMGPGGGFIVKFTR